MNRQNVTSFYRTGGLDQADFDLVVECARAIAIEHTPLEISPSDRLTIRRCQTEMYTAERSDIEIAFAASDYLNHKEFCLVKRLMKHSLKLKPEYDVDPLVYALHDEYEDAFSQAFTNIMCRRYHIASSLFTKVGIICAVRTSLDDIAESLENNSSEQLAALAAGF